MKSAADRERADVADLIRHVKEMTSSEAADQGNSSPTTAALPRQGSWCDATYRKVAAPEVSEERRRLCTPGGFRRNHMITKADELGVPLADRPENWTSSLIESLYSMDLLEYHFGLNIEDDEDYKIQHKHLVGGLSNLGVCAAVFKGNMAANVLYMPHAWQQGGWLFGFVALGALAAISVVCVVRLLKCRTPEGVESYGDLMEMSMGKSGRAMVNVSIVLLQLGSCCSYLVNVANMVRKIFPTLTLQWLICVEAILITPFVLIRNMAKLSPINMMGGLLTLVGIFITFVALGEHLISGEQDLSEVKAFNADGVLVCLGIACFAFEGIGLVIPIYDSCRHPESFSKVYGGTIAGIMFLISTMSGLGYMAFGESTNTLILLNLGGQVSAVIEFMFSLVMMGSFPLQMLPGIRIVEGLFLAPSRPGTNDKHIKSAFRVCVVAMAAGVSIVASTSLDHFVSLVGAVCGLPLAFVFPAICHRTLVGEAGTFSSMVDMTLVVFGVTIMIVVGAQNLMTWGS